MNDDRLFLVVARVAGHSRSVPAGAKQLGGGHPNGCGIGEARRGGRYRRERHQSSPQVEVERGCETEKAKRQAGQHERLFCGGVHLFARELEAPAPMRPTANCSMLNLFLPEAWQPMESR